MNNNNNIMEIFVLNTSKDFPKTFDKSTIEVILNLINVIIIIIDIDGIVRFINKKGSSILGYKSEEIIGKHWFDNYVYHEEKDHVKSLFYKIINDENYPTLFSKITNKVVTKEGDTHIIEWDNIIIFDDAGIITHTLSSGSDISDIIKLKEDKCSLENQLYTSQKLEAIGRLAGGISHDFNNLLHVIRGYSELSMIEAGLSNKIYDNINMIIKTTDRAAELTKQLLLFSRCEKSIFKIIDTKHLLDDIFKMLKRVIGENINITLNIQEDIDFINADCTQIEQVILNLCINSRDAIVKDGIISITVKNIILTSDFCKDNNWAVEGKYVCLSVEDNGCGIPVENIPKLFEPFFTTKKVGEGTGLGLPIVYGVVKSHNGLINVESKVGVGSKFSIYIPSIDKNSIEINKLLECNIEMIGGKETILLVEDDNMVLEINNIMLSNFGYNIIQARNGKEAVEIFKLVYPKIDLILSDIIMPVMTGVESARIIRNIDKTVPIILMTGYTDSTEKDFCILQKPVKAQLLLQIIREKLEERKRLIGIPL